MMRKIFGSLVVASIALVGCEAAKKETKEIAKKAGDVAAKAGEAASKAAAVVSDKLKDAKDAFKKKFEGPIGDYTKKFDDLKAKASSATGDEKAKLDEKVKAVTDYMGQLKQKLTGAGDVAEDKWDDFKKSCEDLIEKVKKILD